MERLFVGKLPHTLAEGLLLGGLWLGVTQKVSSIVFDQPISPGHETVLTETPAENYQDLLDDLGIEVDFTPLDPLAHYLQNIEGEKQTITAIISSRTDNILKGIKNISQERLLEEFEKYFPMYKAGEIEFEVPWSLLMIIHAHETTFSSDSETYNRLHRGAMQRAVGDWPDKEIYEASANWEFLVNLDQSYPNDFREILWAAYYIRHLAQIYYPDLSDEQSALMIVKERYSAPENAVLRVAKYKELKSLLQISS